MNWNDYARGYDDGKDDYRNSGNSGNLLITLLQFAFSILILLLRLVWGILKGLLSLLWTIVKLIARRKL